LKKIICYLLIALMSMNPTNAFAATFLNDVFNIYDYVETSTDNYQNPEQETTFIVEIEGDPLLATMRAKDLTGKTATERAFLKNQESIIAKVASAVDLEFDNEFVYTALFNGFSVTGKYSDFEKIKAIPGVKNVYISKEFQTVEPVDENSLEAMSVYNSAFDEFDGEGLLIGVIDTGFEKTHSFFKDEPHNPKLTKEKLAEILTKNNLKSEVKSADSVYVSAKIPYAYNYYTKSTDTYMSGIEHGLHVSGIAAGKNGKLPNGESFSGIAPEAQLAFFGCGNNNGGIPEEKVLAAIEDAALLGVDIINMSFGIDYADFMNGAFGEAVLEKAREAGIAVFAASGNAGRGFQDQTPRVQNIDYSASGVPAGRTAVTSVASVDGDTYFQNVLKFVTPENLDLSMINAYQTTDFTTLFSDVEYIEYVDCNYGKKEDFDNIDLTGKIALVKRGNLNFTEKAENAKAANAIGIIIYNTENDFFTRVEELCIPGATTTASYGEKLVAANNKKIKFSGTGMDRVSPQNAGKPSAFSSWGVDSSLQLKPEISAPGGRIYSSVYNNKFGTMSGTSMATPYMSGVMACVLEYYNTCPFANQFNNLAGKEKVSLLENIIMNSANVIRYKDTNLPYSPRKQGAGRVSMENLLKSKVIIKGDSGKAKLSLGDDINDTLSLNFEITNISKNTVTFDDVTVEVLTDGYFTQNNENYVGDSVSLKIAEENLPESITIPSGETYNFFATVKLDENQLVENSRIFTNGFFIDGFVILNAKDNTTKASVPFTGFYGDWGKAPVFDKTIYEDGGSELVDPQNELATGTFLALQINEEGDTVPLGRNPFDLDILSEDAVCYSTLKKNTLMVIGTNYRSASKISFLFKNLNGTYQSKEIPCNQFINKFRAVTFYLPVSEYGDMNDGAYLMQINAKIAGPTNATDIKEIPFYVDNTAPEIESVEYNPNNKTISVTAKDEKALSAIYVTYTDKNQNKISELKTVLPQDSVNGFATKTFDISKAGGLDKLGVGCVDYAINESNGYYRYYTDDLGVELWEIDRDSYGADLKVYVVNNKASDITSQLTVAFYDEKNTLIAVKSVKRVFKADMEEIVRFAFNEDTTLASKLKLFVWGDKNIKSILPPHVIDLSTIK